MCTLKLGFAHRRESDTGKNTTRLTRLQTQHRVDGIAQQP